MSGLTFERTEEAGNGKEALEKLSQSPVDLILCDVNMPEMNGPDMVKQVRQMDSCKNTKIVMVSTESSDENDRTDPSRWGQCLYHQALYSGSV